MLSSLAVLLLLLLYVEGTHVHKSCKCTAASSQSPPSYLPCPAALLPAGNIYVQVDFATVCRLSVAPPSTRYPPRAPALPLVRSHLQFQLLCHVDAPVSVSVSVSLSLCVCTQVAHMMSLIRCPSVRPSSAVSGVRCPLSVVS